METYRFINELDISYLHVFTYSERVNTPAAEMENPVPMAERRRRNEMLRILSEKKRRHFYSQHENTVRSILIETNKSSGKMVGLTDNYIKVLLEDDPALENTICKVRLGKVLPDGTMSGKLVGVGKEFLV